MNDNTNRGSYRTLDWDFRGATPPSSFYLALCTADTTPTKGTNTLGEMTEIAAGNGYTSGGYVVNRNGTDFPTILQDDVNNKAEVTMRDFGFTASGGTMPSSGNGIRYVVLTDDNASVGSREIIGMWDLGSDFVISDGQTLTFKAGKIERS